MIGADEQALLDGFNATTAVWPSDRLIHELVEAQAARTPDADAVRLGQRTLRYAELDSEANRPARQLRARGVGPDDAGGAVCRTQPGDGGRAAGGAQGGRRLRAARPEPPGRPHRRDPKGARPAVILSQRAYTAALCPPARPRCCCSTR